MDKIYYISSVIFLLYLIMKWYSKQHFWSRQPVFHRFNIKLWIYPCGLIQHSLLSPSSSDYLTDVKTYTIETIPSLYLEKYIQLIRKHYIIDEELSYEAPRDNIYEYLNTKGYISVYQSEKAYQYKKGWHLYPSILSGIASRPITFFENEKEVSYGYYTDFLCTHEKYRKKNVTPKVIYTHVCDIMNTQKNPCFYLFKREGEYTPFVPILSSFSYIYNIKYVFKEKYPLQCISVTKNNLFYLYEKIKKLKKEFSLCVYTSFTHLQHLLEVKNLFITMVSENNHIRAFYVFTNNYMTHRKEPIIELSCSYREPNFSEELFHQGLLSSLVNISRENLVYLVIDNLSHNYSLIDKMKYKSMEETPMSYYIYNYASYPKQPKECFILV